MDSKVSRGWKSGLRPITAKGVRRGIAVLLSAGAIATAAYFTASTWAIRHDTITFYDASRDNRPVAVDIAVRRDKEMQAKAGMINRSRSSITAIPSRTPNILSSQT
jgi:hypothetical protein